MVIAAVLMIAIGSLLPIWRIEIWAPQYPEGLVMQIGAHDIVGNVDQINILNHYIGMKHIVPAQIPELTVIPWLIGLLVAFGATSAILNKRSFYYAWFSTLVIAAVGGLIDYFIWGYDYGHNLEPNAPIKIPGMTYQPPLIGEKILLNIHSFSIPDIGGYILLAAGTLAFVAIFGDKLARAGAHLGILCRKTATHSQTKTALLLGLAFVTGLIGCKTQPDPLRLNVDSCDECHMRISSSHFGGEIISSKGRIHKFDSVPCLMKFMKKAAGEEPPRRVLVVDYFHAGNLIDANTASFLQSEKISDPMGGGWLATNDQAELEKYKSSTAPGDTKNWTSLTASSF